MYVSWNDSYIKYLNRSPLEELKFCLSLQDDIIVSINKPTEGCDMTNINPGHIELPKEYFWNNTNDYIDKFNNTGSRNPKYMDLYSIELGSYNYINNRKTFVKKFFKGEIFPYYFIKHEKKYYPVLPRRYSAVLIDSWARILISNKNKILGVGVFHGLRNVIKSIINVFKKNKYSINRNPSYSLICGGHLHRYIEERVNVKNIYSVINAIKKNGKHHKLIYGTSIITGNNMILLYLLEPSSNTNRALKRIKHDLNTSINLFKDEPLQISLNLERKLARFAPHDEKTKLNIHAIVIIPTISTEPKGIKYIKDFPARVVALDNLLGVIDEIENINQLIEFFKYTDLEDPRLSPFLSLLDKYGSFKASSGVLVEGANEPNSIALDPNWGSNMRYDSLKKFWEIFPCNYFMRHPRSWEVKQETPTRVRLSARGFFGMALHSRINDTSVFCLGPFDKMTREQGMLTNFLMECIEDTLSRAKEIIKNMMFIKQYKQVDIFIVPISLVTNNDKFAHLRHINRKSKLWMADIGFIKGDILGIRIIFNDKKVIKTFSSVKNNSLEINLLLTFIKQINGLFKEKDYKDITKSIKDILSSQGIRFKLHQAQMAIHFPEFTGHYSPLLKHIKLARKTIAKISKSMNINPGEYDLSQAEKILNQIRAEVVKTINEYVLKYDYKASIPVIISNIDSLSHSFEKDRYSLQKSLGHEVDYDVDDKYSDKHSNYIVLYGNYAYLIEKYVQLSPTGNKIPDKENVGLILALIDILQMLYRASDMLHYTIQPIKLSITDEYLFYIKGRPEDDVKRNEYVKEISKYSLGTKGKDDDRIHLPTYFTDFIEELNNAFFEDMGFTFNNMLLVNDFLSHWHHYNKCKISTYYSSSIDIIKTLCLEKIPAPFSNDELIKIIDFMTLKPEETLKISGQSEICDDLPVWEISKRLYRYNIRPLILIGDQYYWGPYSLDKMRELWLTRVLAGTTPYSVDKNKIDGVIKKIKYSIENKLVEKAYEILGRFTKYIENKCDFQRRFNSIYPNTLGDYDVLGYIEDKNIILNIECTDILQGYCLKDAKRLREKLFGTEENRGKTERIEIREKYLINNISKIMADLKWPSKKDNKPKVVSLCISRYIYYWTVNPPYSTTVKFLRVDSLHEYLSIL
jgi:hypothetical protein